MKIKGKGGKIRKEIETLKTKIETLKLKILTQKLKWHWIKTSKIKGRRRNAFG